MNSYRRILATKPWSKIITDFKSRVTADGGVIDGSVCNNQILYGIKKFINKASLIITPAGYKSNKIFAVKPNDGNGDLIWTRATSATRVNENGLIETVCYNLFNRSEEFNDGVWHKTSVAVTPNNTLDPKGLLTADLLTPTDTDSYLRQFLVGHLTNTIHTASVYLKSATGSDISTRIRLIDTVSSTQQLENIVVTNTWQRFTVTYLVPAGANLQFWLGGSGTLSTGEDLYIWGAQLVEGSVPKDYFPTTDRLNVSRINYPVGGGCPSILLEPQRTNLYVSSTPNNTTWLKFQTGVGSLPTITENNAVSPDGTNNASLISLNLNGGTTIGDRVWVKNNITLTVTNGSSYRASFYIKAKNAVDVGKKINVIAEGLSSSSNSITITLTNNWVRYDFGNVAISTTVNYLFQSRGTLGTSDQVDFLLWGVQFEQGAYATSLIPTTTTAVTRNADTFSLANVYTNGLISASGGSWYVELENNLALTRDTGSFSLYISDTIGIGAGNALIIRSINVTNRLSIAKRTSSVETNFYTTLTDTIKVLFSWNGTTCNIFTNGSKIVTATAFPATALEYLAANGSDVPKHIKSMLLFPSPISDAEAIQLTTL